MSYLNHDPFRSLSNKTQSLPSFEIGRNFLFREKLGKGQGTPIDKSRLAGAGREMMKTPSTVLVPAEQVKIKDIDLDKWRVERILQKYPVEKSAPPTVPHEDILYKLLN
jgi:hypothetical protein